MWLIAQTYVHTMQYFFCMTMYLCYQPYFCTEICCDDLHARHILFVKIAKNTNTVTSQKHEPLQFRLTGQNKLSSMSLFP